MKPSIVIMRNAFFFFSAAATASPIFQALAPRSDAVIPGYFDQGCYTEGTNRRALTGMTYFDDQMTVEKCATACADFVWFGVEYGRECYCGNTLSAGSIPAPAADCNFHCPGNATESCGAGLRLNMYSKTTAAGLETLMTYGAMGCYTEATSGRALNALRVADDTMTIESCATACAGYAMFGLEYYRECYCGDALMPGSTKAPSAECNHACTGNKSELCGGNSRLNLYQFNVVTISVSSSTTAPTTSTASSTLSVTTTTSSTSSHSSTASIQPSTTSKSSQSSTSSVASTASSTSGSSSTISAPSVSLSTSTTSTYSSTSSVVPSTSSNAPLDSTSLLSSAPSAGSSTSLSTSGSSSAASSSSTSSPLSSTGSPSAQSVSSSSSSTASSSAPTVSTPSSTMTFTSSTTGTSPKPTPLICREDNCLRELMDTRFRAKASLFCVTYTTAVLVAPSEIPSYLENCGGIPSAVSSACSCLMPSTTSVLSSVPSTSYSSTSTSSVSGSSSISSTSSSSSVSSSSSDPSSSSISPTSSTYSTSSASSTSSDSSGSSSSPSSLPSTTTFSAATTSAVSSLPSMTLGPDALVLYVQPQSGDDSDPFGGIFGGGDGGGRDDGGSDGSIDGADNGSGDDLSVIRKFKRQTYNTPALVGGGSIHSSCADAHVYTVTADGTLTDNGLTVGAYPGFPNALLVGSSNPGSVQEGFGIGDLGNLFWISPDFPTFFAQFCVINDLVLAVFDGNNPDGCTPVNVFSGPFAEFCPGDGAPAATTFQQVETAAATTSASSTPTPTLPTCSPSSDPEADVTVIPAVDPRVDPSSPINLAPSYYATLYYAEPSPGTTIIEVEYAMTDPQVTLENSNLIETTCTDSTITVTALTSAAFQIISKWPQTSFVLVTNSEGCNPATQRGVYSVVSSVSDETAMAVTLQVLPQTWLDVALTMEVSYGTTSTAPTPSCENPSVTSGASPSSSTGMDVSYANLTPQEKALVAFLTAGNTYDADGNIVVVLPDALQQPVDTSPFDPNADPNQQASDENALLAAGLPSPDTIYNKTQTVLQGYCSNGVYTPAGTMINTRSVGFSPVNFPHTNIPRALMIKRDDGGDDDADDFSFWEFAWDVTCFEVFTDFIGEEFAGGGTLLKLICALKEVFENVKDAYDNRDAIKCAFSSCYIDKPTSTYWDYTSSWTADFPIPPQTLMYNDYGMVSCVDCDASVSEVQFQGRVQVLLSTGALLQAYMTPTVSWTASMIMRMSTIAPFEGDWSYNFPSVVFPSPITVDGEFTITPSMTVGLGLSFSADSAVDFTGGGTVSVNSASMDLDFMAQTANNFQNWDPQVWYNYPIFTTPSTVSWNPIMRSALSISVNILNAPYGAQPIYITSAASVGFNSFLTDYDDGQCSAGQLEVTSYSNVESNVLFSGGNPQLLASTGNGASETKCFTVPNDHPTRDEINSLKSAENGGAFCTSYIDYWPPVSLAYADTTKYTPTTVHTALPTTIYTTSYTTIMPTYTSVHTDTITVGPTSTVYYDGSQYLGDNYMKRRDLSMPSPTTTPAAKRAAPKSTQAPPLPNVTKRQVNEPAIVSTWDASKISLACSQIATGTSTATLYTSTAYSFSGTFTSTYYTNVNAVGKIVTQTSASTVWSVTATPTTIDQGETATTSIATSCPLQTQVSCFTITGHGAPHIDGKQLYSNPNFASPIFGGWYYDGFGDWDPTTYYLTCAGDLVSVASLKTLAQAADGNTFVEFVDLVNSPDGGTAVTCQKDEVKKTLQCGNGWFSYNPKAGLGDWTTESAGGWTPPWSSTQAGVMPIGLTYEEVPCPCAY